MTDKRHPGVEELRTYFEFAHLPEDLRKISQPVGELAEQMLTLLPDDGPELTAALRKLLEAKDCLVRHALTLQRRSKYAGDR